MNAPAHPETVYITVAEGTPAAQQQFVLGSLGQYSGKPYRIASVIWLNETNRRVRLISVEAWERGVR